MKLSLSWLREYVPLGDIDSTQLVHDITTHVAELEGVEDMKTTLANIFVGKALSVEPHPNADRLRISQVDLGADMGTRQIVCGASNLEAGQIIAVAIEGAKVFGGSVTIKKTKIRGEQSNGMICAEDEIGLGGDHLGIMVLDPALESQLGTPLADALQLDDIILDIDNKAISHRPDLWCHLGFAREIAAIYNLPQPQNPTITLPTAEASDLYSISLETDDCLRYAGMSVSGIPAGLTSPAWMQKRLESCGIRPISLLVDLTNYVMLEQGQPLHAFDADKLSGNDIIVRNAQEGEKIITLDDQERTLSDSYVVIDDGKDPVAVAGVMGGASTEIDSTTTSVFFEAATFKKKPVREARIGLGLQSESSNRFEKGLNPVLPSVALNRVAELLAELCPEATIASVQEAHNGTTFDEITEDTVIVTTRDYLAGISGVDISSSEICDTFAHLGLVATGTDTISVTIPYYRHTDLCEPADLAEEFIRIYGLENLPTVAPSADVIAPTLNTRRQFEWKLRDILSSLETHDVHLYDFINEELLNKCGFDLDGIIGVNNALTTDCTHLSPTLIPQLLLCTDRNLRFQDTISLSRIGKVYSQTFEKLSISGSYSAKKESTPYHHIQSIVSGLFAALNLSVSFTPSTDIEPLYHPGRHATLSVNGTTLGRIGELHPLVQNNLGIKERVAIYEIDFDLLFELYNSLPTLEHQSTPTFPSVTQDFSLLVDRLELAENLRSSVLSSSSLATECTITDVYMGEGIPDDKKSVSLRFTLLDSQATLTEEVISEARQNIIESLQKLGAEIRGL